MRVHKEKGGFTVHAVVGTHVVHLGFNVSSEMRRGLLGFAIHRADKTENESYWIPNMRYFPGHGGDKGKWPTIKAPVQKFRWADYTAKPLHDYVYEVSPVYGTPENLKPDAPIQVKVRTEDPASLRQSNGTVHQVYFSRSAAASQAYVKRFGEQSPERVPGGAALEWLSRGLLEGLLAFIDRARNSRDALYVAIYESQYEPILEHLEQAVDRGVTVRLLYDGGSSKTSPYEDNKKAIRKVGLAKYAKARKGLKSRISHHKFIVLVRNGKPVSVWTGSTNMSKNAIYAQLNVGHAVDDPVVAGAFLKLHEALWANDPDRRETCALLETEQVVPAENKQNHFIFSPRSKAEALDFYIHLMEQSQSLVVLTTPFGVDEKIQQFLLSPSQTSLRFGLVGHPDRYGGQVTRLDSIDGTMYSMPARIESMLDKWQREQFHFKTHAYIHTKFLIVDPLSDSPTVVTGSANFSKASCVNNDENMLVIRGHTSVADVYLTEFLRMFEHYAYRHFVETNRDRLSKFPLYTTDRWTNRYFRPGSERMRDRLIFSGHADRMH